MFRARIIPCLLMRDDGGLVKTIAFKEPHYVGDPINAVRIFNEKEVDELILLDIGAARHARGPDFARIRNIIDEAFMPVAYGGGVSDVAQARELVGMGVEKVIVNSALRRGMTLLSDIAAQLGSQAVVGAIDVKRDSPRGFCVYDHLSGRSCPDTPLAVVESMVRHGAGELFVNDVDREGTGAGYDLHLIRTLSTAVNVPLVICGGGSTTAHLRDAVMAGASAVAVGSMFVYVGRRRAVMINYPTQPALRKLLADS